MKNCSVIVPVYNAFEATQRCLESVLEHCENINRLIVIDDCSPDGDLANYLPPAVRGHALIDLSRNERNLGFVGTCNTGMSAAGEDDVILLNSDTVVTKGWVSKLRRAAYSREEVGTVTPLTNNGTICSVPRFCQDNSIPTGFTIESFAELVERVSGRFYPELPTCVGFCVYIKREFLNKIGLFDESAFGLGYGEENDLSCRGHRAGFVDILDDATFIYHEGTMSFVGKDADLKKRNLDTLSKRYPHYLDSVGRFCSRNPLRPVQLRILDELTVKQNESRPFRVLHILQNGPHTSRRDCGLGGTELHVADIIRLDPQVSHWSLVPTKRAYFLTAHLPGREGANGEGAQEREFILDLRYTSLENILRPDNFDLIHLHHSRYYDHLELCRALQKHGNYLISFHDFILGCPRFHLMTPFRKVCNGHECVQSCGYGRDYIREYRDVAGDLLRDARSLICFSQDTRDRIENIFGNKTSSQFRWSRVPHGIRDVDDPAHRAKNAGKQRPTQKDPLRVAFLGYVPQHKGALIIEEAIRTTQLTADTKVEWHVVGKLFLENAKNVIQHGEYQREELRAKLEQVKPHVIAILSICPETYCMTLDEAWNAGIPVIVTPLGAPAERMVATGGGWVMQDLSADAFLGKLREIVNDWPQYQAACEAISKSQIFTVAEEVNRYSELYGKFPGTSASDLRMLLQFLRGFGLERAPEVGAVGLLLGKVMNRIIYLLDSMHVRAHIQKAANGLLPARFLRELKSLR